jgi:hypothetical protein
MPSPKVPRAVDLQAGLGKLPPVIFAGLVQVEAIDLRLC